MALSMTIQAHCIIFWWNSTQTSVYSTRFISVEDSGAKKFTAKSIEWGKEHEPKVLEAYVKRQQDSGYPGLFACKSGFVISETHPFLGASPDACVHDPLHDEPFGLA